jgi:adenine-specific DNA methylase
MAEAELGTVRDGRLVHPMNPERSGVEISTIRGDYRTSEGITRNRLRRWERLDFMPRSDDLLQERLYAIQWITKETLDSGRQETYFTGITEDDLSRERQVETIVRDNLARWQSDGLVPDMSIKPGEKTDEPIRARGWTHWHHLFCPRQLPYLAKLMERIITRGEPALYISMARTLDWTTKLCRYGTGAARESISQTFDICSAVD